MGQSIWRLGLFPGQHLRKDLIVGLCLLHLGWREQNSLTIHVSDHYSVNTLIINSHCGVVTLFYPARRALRSSEARNRNRGYHCVSRTREATSGSQTVPGIG